MTPLARLFPLAAALFLGACAHTPPDDPSDPFERLNRGVFAFNQTADRYIARPVARQYVTYVPKEIQNGLHNFFDNITYPTVIINGALQGKLKQSGLDTGRFLFNTTVGIAGFIDAASMIGLERHNEDFGQTLGYWGLGQGYFVMLPLLGPSSGRDILGTTADAFTNPAFYINTTASYSLATVALIDRRANLLAVDGVLEQQLDPYIFLRGAYLQRRLSLVYDGSPPAEMLYGVEDE